MTSWMDSVPEEEHASLRAPKTLPFGKRTALIVIDVTLGFTGSEGLTADDARREYSTAAGPAAWEAMPRIAQLIGFARANAMPVVFTRSSENDQRHVGNATKKPRSGDGVASGFGDFPTAIAPASEEWILEKSKASAFFQTPLATYLVKEGIESVIICGVSTSGCVRATTVDACSSGFSVFVIDEACFDRSWFAHCNNLFDMNAKYADVLSLSELERKWKLA